MAAIEKTGVQRGTSTTPKAMSCKAAELACAPTSASCQKGSTGLLATPCRRKTGVQQEGMFNLVGHVCLFPN